MTRPLSLSLAAGLVGFALIAARAQASIVFTAGNNPQPDEQTIQFGATQSGKLFTGTTNQTNTAVQFTSNVNLETSGIGQASLIGPGNTNIPAGTNVTFTIPGFTFQDFIFNPLITGPGTSPGSAIISAVDNSNQTFTLTPNPILGNGQNFFTLTAVGGDTITSVSLLLGANTTIGSLGQFRVSGVSQVPLPPAALLFGTALGGLGVLGWRRKKKLAA
jgi:hypothetical protein